MMQPASIYSFVLGFFALILLCAFGMFLVNDYGLTIDEYVHMTRVKGYFHTWRLLWEGKPIGYEEGMHYGVFFNLIAHPFLLNDSVTDLANYQRKHVVTFLFSLLGYLGLALAYRSFFNIHFGFVFAALVLISMPPYFGHSFYNPKDSPFAALYTLCSAGLGIRIGLVLSQSPLKRRQLYGEMLLAGLLIILGFSVRIAGVSLAVCWALLLLCLGLKLSPSAFWKRARTLTPLFAGTALISIVGFIALYPALLQSGIKWIHGTYNFYSNAAYLERLCRFINGTCYRGNELPWYYIPVYFFLKLPLLHLYFGGIGIAWFTVRWHQRTVQQKAIGAMMMMQLLCLPLIMIALRTPPYDGERHFLYMWPAWGFFSFCGMWVSWHSLRRIRYKLLLGLIAVWLWGSVIRDMVALHPYQHTYMNEPSRLFMPLNMRWNMDYWGLSAKPMAHWLDNNIPGVARAFGKPVNAFRFFKRGNWEQLNSIPYDSDKPFYVARFARDELEDRSLDKCKIVYREERRLSGQPITMGIIRFCFPAALRGGDAR